uniref:Ubiquitin carboxyl-terminal hydrolase n=2 Tax=Schistocephalus solidus TaxID=70667 RepID=A0A0X3PAE1_SCHSO
MQRDLSCETRGDCAALRCQKLPRTLPRFTGSAGRLSQHSPTCYANDLNFDGSLRTSPFAAAVASRPVLYDFQKYSSGISRSTPHSGTTITYPMPKKTEPQTRPPYQSSTRSSKPLSTSSYSLRMGNESGNHLSRTKSIPHLGCPPRNNVYDHSYHREMELKSTFPPSRKQETSQFSYYPSSPARSRDVVAKMSNLTLRDNSCSRVQAFQNGYVSNIRSPSCSASESRYRCPSTSDDYMDGRRTVYHPPLNVNNASTAYYEPESSVSGSRRSSNTQGGLVGLSNLGNTCFMNSVLQCLSNTQALAEACLDRSYINDLNESSSMRGKLFEVYADLMRQIWEPTNGPQTYISPQRFKAQIQKFAPRFMGYAQQDAQEFLRYLLQGLHEDVNRVQKRPPSENPDYDKEDKMPDAQKAELYWRRYKAIDNSIIADLFMGQLMSTLECTSCGYKSTTFDPFWDLSLPIPKMAPVTIIDCFELFTSKEVLDGAEQPVCSGCKSRQRCRKSFSIQRFPQILVIHFKRFSGERSRSKLTTLIDFPSKNLNLMNFVSECSPQKSASYDLYAISNHSGSVYGGHYTAYCRHPYLNTWFEFNDTRVSQIRQSDIVSSEAYVLFYQLKNSSR